MSEIYDEELNVRLGELAYTLAEKDILKAVIGAIEETKDRELFEDFDLKQLLEDCFEEAMETVYGK